MSAAEESAWNAFSPRNIHGSRTSITSNLTPKNRVAKDAFNHVDFAPITTTAIRIEVEPTTKHYKSGEIGPPDAMFLSKEMDWREFGLIEWRVR